LLLFTISLLIVSLTFTEVLEFTTCTAVAHYRTMFSTVISILKMPLFHIFIIIFFASRHAASCTQCDFAKSRKWVTVNVVCIMYTRSGLYISRYYGSGSGQIWLSNLRCTGNEYSLAECQHNGWGVHSCDYRGDVSIVCGNCKSNCVLNTDLFSRSSLLYAFLCTTFRTVRKNQSKLKRRCTTATGQLFTKIWRHNDIKIVILNFQTLKQNTCTVYLYSSRIMRLTTNVNLIGQSATESWPEQYFPIWRLIAVLSC